MNKKTLLTILLPAGALTLTASLVFALNNEQSSTSSNTTQASSESTSNKTESNMKVITTSGETKIMKQPTNLKLMRILLF
ncbi:hypothetical protein [Saccharibacillus deserti]|uniref:hypothetical protein n=1 Tax=Saccharibacillus deserti TaxID=1634444 RepID=UPI0015520E5C|nr:hypothetical protein [Saccharibacillus deserti]